MEIEIDNFKRLKDGPAGDNEDIQVYFEIPISAATDYVSLPNHFAARPNVQGAITIGSGAEVYDDNGYGLDIEFQEYIFSPDYDLLSAR